MTAEQYCHLIQDLERQLYIADYGMGMPRDAERVQRLKKLLAEAQEEARLAVLASLVLSS